MNLINFTESFPDESSCRIKFREFRDAHAVVCRKCGSTDHYWLKTIEKYQCKKCKTRTSLRSGTVMQESNLPFRYWFLAIHLLTGTKKSFSALELQRQLGHKYYEPIWYMLQKLRKTMGSRDNRYQLDRIVELDERYFKTVDTEKDGRSGSKKRGPDSSKHTSVMVMASTENISGKVSKRDKPSRFRYVKMVFEDSLKGQTIGEKVSEKIRYGSLVKTDDYSSYSKIRENVPCPMPQAVKPKGSGKVLPWVNIMIINARRTLLGVHHMISAKYAQNYLDEFCYKVNRRNYGEKLFDRLLIACVTSSNKNIIIHSRQS